MSSDIDSLRSQFEAYLQNYLNQNYKSVPLGEVIHYAMSGQGKRVRPLFCMLTAEALGVKCGLALAPALAVEMVHTYSLVHDDLPCMDNDDLRRGRPTTHKKYSEGWALLAGDGLLTDAFALLCEECRPELDTNIRFKMIRELAVAAGSRGMVEGQALDIYWTGRIDAKSEQLDLIHNLKTGALLGAACALGALTAKADDTTVAILRKFGQLIGLAFQIRDDLIDQNEGIGKTKGKDLESGKLTYLRMMSSSDAEAAASRCTKDAIDLLEPIGQNGKQLKKLAHLLLERNM